MLASITAGVSWLLPRHGLQGAALPIDCSKQVFEVVFAGVDVLLELCLLSFDYACNHTSAQQMYFTYMSLHVCLKGNAVLPSLQACEPATQAAGLQLAQVLLLALPDMYTSLFVREGVVHAVARMAQAQVQLATVRTAVAAAAVAPPPAAAGAGGGADAQAQASPGGSAGIASG